MSEVEAVDFEIERVRRVAEEVPDPELPFVTIGELGMVRGVERDGERLRVALTPTYSGCPATEMIQQMVQEALSSEGFDGCDVVFQRAPAWTTEWISESGRKKLKEAGIAPPPKVVGALPILHAFEEREVPCPLCGSSDTERLAEHGSTPCKALYRCRSCREPFDHFKCH